MDNIREAIQEKQKIVEIIKGSIESSAAVIFTDCKGLGVPDITELRRELKKSDSSLKVYKNTLIKRALEDLNLNLNDVLFGPTALITVKDDAAAAAKGLSKFIKDHDVVTIKGGLLGKVVLGNKEINELAKIPPKDILLGQVVGGFKSPITQFVTNMSSPIRGLVYVLNSIKDKQK